MDRRERTRKPGRYSGIKRTVDKCVLAEQLEQASWDRAAGKGQLV
jgi:hypothetical protein